MKDVPRLDANGRGSRLPGLIFCLWLLSALLSGCGGASESEETIRFHVEKGLAVDTLKEAASQANVEFIFSSELVGELRTPEIKGKYTPSAAFKLMLADSPFVVLQHQESGVYSIQKSPHH
jgi:hypothetical protein